MDASMILLVADDATLTSAVRRVVRTIPVWTIAVAESSVGGYARLLAAAAVPRDPSFSLLILDMDLRYSSPGELLRLVERNRRIRDVPILLLAQQQVAKRDGLGPMSMSKPENLTKPIDDAELLGAMKSALTPSAFWQR